MKIEIEEAIKDGGSVYVRNDGKTVITFSNYYFDSLELYENGKLIGTAKSPNNTALRLQGLAEDTITQDGEAIFTDGKFIR